MLLGLFMKFIIKYTGTMMNELENVRSMIYAIYIESYFAGSVSRHIWTHADGATRHNRGNVGPDLHCVHLSGSRRHSRKSGVRSPL